MTSRTYDGQPPNEGKPGSQPFRFSESLISKMATLLEERSGRPISMAEADDALARLTECFRILLDYRDSPKATPQN
jgi:hypothetical protein